jgi:hypothetical protein
MDIVEKFLSHAGGCRVMARFTRDLESKAVWNRMADRWLALAVNEKTRRQQRSELRIQRAHQAQSHGG